MNRIIQAFVGIDLSFNKPFCTGVEHYHAHSNLHAILDEYECPFAKDYKYGFVAYDDQTGSLSVLDRWHACEVAKKAGQLKPEYSDANNLSSYMLTFSGVPAEVDVRIDGMRDDILQGLKRKTF